MKKLNTRKVSLLLFLTITQFYVINAIQEFSKEAPKKTAANHKPQETNEKTLPKKPIKPVEKAVPAAPPALTTDASTQTTDTTDTGSSESVGDKVKIVLEDIAYVIGSVIFGAVVLLIYAADIAWDLSWYDRRYSRYNRYRPSYDIQDAIIIQVESQRPTDTTYIVNKTNMNDMKLIASQDKRLQADNNTSLSTMRDKITDNVATRAAEEKLETLNAKEKLINLQEQVAEGTNSSTVVKTETDVAPPGGLEIDTEVKNADVVSNPKTEPILGM
ncbi:MAG: hypothetical protein P4L22_03840 [Candidatus Babeliales bacterium]|nr:hypothetical protein [Candidatus Babeliales bacterium]